MTDDKLTAIFGVRISEELQQKLRALPRRKRQPIAEKIRLLLEKAVRELP